MKVKAIFQLVVLVGLALASQAWADNDRYNCQGNDKAAWTSNSSSTSINVGGTGDLDVYMKSPMCLNTYPDFPGALPVYTDVGLDSAMCPDGSSGSEATCTLAAPVASLPSNPQDYTAFGQAQTYGVHFDATNATPGTYTFHVHANASDPDQTHQNGDNLDHYGWGYGGGVELTVTVTQPQPTCDQNDSLIVRFATPAAGDVHFCNGGTSIPVNLTASDTTNKITSLTASVNNVDITGSLALSGEGTLSASAIGMYSGGGVGAYAFRASATTACTNGSAGPITVNLIYVLSGLDSPLGGTNPRKGRTVPIKFIPKDCTGNAVPQDNSVEIKVYNSSSALLEDSTPAGCTGSSCGAGASSYVSFDSSSGQYQTNFGSPTTADTYTVKIFFGGVKNYETTFTTQ